MASTERHQHWEMHGPETPRTPPDPIEPDPSPPPDPRDPPPYPRYEDVPPARPTDVMLESWPGREP